MGRPGRRRYGTAVFVIGGGVADAGEIAARATEKAYMERLNGRGRGPSAKV